MLFWSGDGGITWEVNRGLLEHPTREKWQPGAGGMCCHSIQVVNGTIYVAISAAGAFRSDDGGDTWTPINKEVAADFHPEKYPEVGQCVHKLLVHPARPDRLWQQNHCGVYRSDDRGDNWERLDGNGLPSDFGFGLALDATDPDIAYVIPEVSGEQHFTPDGRLGVYRTGDGGASWQLTANGLPERAWSAVLREGFAYDDGGLYFGTQSGSVWTAPPAATSGSRRCGTCRRSSRSKLPTSEVAVVLLPGTLAAEAGGQKRFELQAATVGEALRQLPVANLLFDEAGELRRLVNVYVDSVDARGGLLLDEPLTDESEVRIVGAVASVLFGWHSIRFLP